MLQPNLQLITFRTALSFRFSGWHTKSCGFREIRHHFHFYRYRKLQLTWQFAQHVFSKKKRAICRVSVASQMNMATSNVSHLNFQMSKDPLISLQPHQCLMPWCKEVTCTARPSFFHGLPDKPAVIQMMRACFWRMMFDIKTCHPSPRAELWQYMDRDGSGTQRWKDASHSSLEYIKYV